MQQLVHDAAPIFLSSINQQVSVMYIVLLKAVLPILLHFLKGRWDTDVMAVSRPFWVVDLLQTYYIA